MAAELLPSRRHSARVRSGVAVGGWSMSVAETAQSGPLWVTGWFSACNRMSPDRGEGMSGTQRAELGEGHVIQSVSAPGWGRISAWEFPRETENLKAERRPNSTGFQVSRISVFHLPPVLRCRAEVGVIQNGSIQVGLPFPEH